MRALFSDRIKVSDGCGLMLQLLFEKVLVVVGFSVGCLEILSDPDQQFCFIYQTFKILRDPLLSNVFASLQIFDN